MGKNNKVRRIEKKKKNAKQLIKKQAQKSTVNPTKLSSPVLSVMENPLKHLSDEQRKEIINEIGKYNQSKLPELLSTLHKMLKEHSPITLLAIISGYGLSVGCGKNGVESKEGKSGLSQSHVEMLQALCLQIPKSYWGAKPVSPDVVQTAWNTLIELSRVFSLSRMNGNILDVSSKDKAINKIQEGVRTNTQIVRNWGYYTQVNNLSGELYNPFDETLENSLGFSATRVC